MSPASPWLKHGFWNTLEHGLTRFGDALMSLALMWALAPEAFSRLVVAQAVTAPFLLFFISPGWALYRMFSTWKAEGPSEFAARVFALRLFGWGLGQLALALAAMAAFVMPSASESWSSAFFAALWAFSLYAGGHLSGADRELLRLELRFRELNLITIYQKVSVVLATVVIAFQFGGRTDFLAGAAVFSMVTTAWLARWRAGRVLVEIGASPDAIRGKVGPSPFQTITEVLKGFSLWNHVSGVILNWIQTLDVFFLGVFRLPAAQVGLYAAALKVANLSYALPNALGNLFLVWVGRRSPEGFRREYREIARMSGLLSLGAAVQGGVLILIAPWIVEFLSHGRWSPDEQMEMTRWMRWMLGGAAVFAVTFLVNSWLVLRASMLELFLRVYFPWLVFAGLVYGISVILGGPSYAAIANVPVAGCYVALLGLEMIRVRLHLERQHAG